MKIYVTGVSGTGKSSVAKLLRTKGVAVVDIDDSLSQWIHKDTKQSAEWAPGMSDEWYAFHGWTCDTKKLKKVLSENENIVVMGAAVNQAEYLSLFDKIYILQASPETIIARINSRTDNDFGKHEIEQTRLLNWRQSYADEMKKIGAIEINANRPIEAVAEDIFSNFS